MCVRVFVIPRILHLIIFLSSILQLTPTQTVGVLRYRTALRLSWEKFDIIAALPNMKMK